MALQAGFGGGVTKKKAAPISNFGVSSGQSKPTTSYALKPQPVSTVATQRATQAYVAPVATTTRSVSPLTSTTAATGGSSSGSGGSGGSSAATGTAAASAGVVAKIPTLQDYINKNYLLTTTDAENSRKLQDFDAESLAGRQDTEADQAKREAYLDQDLDRQGQDSAESFASRGLGRSGLVFQAQDKIDASGEKQRDGIDDLLTDYLKQRTSSRLQQQAQNRSSRAAVIQQLTDAYNTAVNNGTAGSLTTLG